MAPSDPKHVSTQPGNTNKPALTIKELQDQLKAAREAAKQSKGETLIQRAVLFLLQRSYQTIAAEISARTGTKATGVKSAGDELVKLVGAQAVNDMTTGIMTVVEREVVKALRQK